MHIKPSKAIRERYLDQLIRDIPEHVDLVREWMAKGYTVTAIGTDLERWRNNVIYPGGLREYPQEPVTIWLAFLCDKGLMEENWDTEDRVLLPNGECVVKKKATQDPAGEATYCSPTDPNLRFSANEVSKSMFFNPTAYSDGTSGRRADGWRASPIPNLRGFNVLFYQNFASEFRSVAELGARTSAGSSTETDTELRWALLPEILPRDTNDPRSMALWDIEDRPEIFYHDLCFNHNHHAFGRYRDKTKVQSKRDYSLVLSGSEEDELEWGDDADSDIRICWFFHHSVFRSSPQPRLWQDSRPERIDLL